MALKMEKYNNLVNPMSTLFNPSQGLGVFNTQAPATGGQVYLRLPNGELVPYGGLKLSQKHSTSTGFKPPIFHSVVERLDQ